MKPCIPVDATHCHLKYCCSFFGSGTFGPHKHGLSPATAYTKHSTVDQLCVELRQLWDSTG